LKGDGYAGGPLKEILTSHWSDPNTGATNSSGFSALPGGYRTKDGTFTNQNVYGGWWVNKEYTKSVAWYRFVDNVSSSIHNSFSRDSENLLGKIVGERTPFRLFN